MSSYQAREGVEAGRGVYAALLAWKAGVLAGRLHGPVAAAEAAAEVKISVIPV